MDTITTTSPHSTLWHAAYPEASHTPVAVSRDEVLALIKQGEQLSHREYILIDLRRNDHEGGSICHSINLPAQSLFPTIPTLYLLFKSAKIRKVIWYCNSSRGRGNRAAAWFHDYIVDQGDEQMHSLVLTEGVRGWALAGPEFTQWMTEYEEKTWS